MQSRDHLNAGIFVSYSVLTITALHAGNLAKGMTSASQINLHAVSVQIFTDEQQIRIKHRRRSVRKQKASDPCNTSKDDYLDLLGDDVEAFSSSQADLEGVADNLFSSPCPQTLRFEAFAVNEKSLRGGGR